MIQEQRMNRTEKIVITTKVTAIREVNICTSRTQSEGRCSLAEEEGIKKWVPADLIVNVVQYFACISRTIQKSCSAMAMNFQKPSAKCANSKLEL